MLKIMTLLLLATSLTHAEKLKFSTELKCLESVQKLVNVTNDVGYFDQKSHTFTFNDDKFIYIVSGNQVKRCPYENGEVTYAIPVSEKNKIYYSITQAFNFYGDVEIVGSKPVEGCKDILDQDIESKVQSAIKTILVKTHKNQSENKPALTPKENTLAQKTCEPVYTKLNISSLSDDNNTTRKPATKTTRKAKSGH